MREIKFRGKRIEDGEWIIGDLVTETDADLIVKRMFIHLRLSPVDFVGDSLTSKLRLHEVDPETVGQYTGLKDKQCHEIYENDIAIHDGSCGALVSAPYGIPRKYGTGESFIFSTIECGLVARHISSFGDSMYEVPNCIIKGWKIIDAYQLWNLQGGFKIIGNVHDNPELLGVE